MNIQLPVSTELIRTKTVSFSSFDKTLCFSGLCWLVVAFLRGLTGKAMTSAFLSIVRCQLRWTFRRRGPGKVPWAQPAVLRDASEGQQGGSQCSRTVGYRPGPLRVRFSCPTPSLFILQFSLSLSQSVFSAVYQAPQIRNLVAVHKSSLYLTSCVEFQASRRKAGVQHKSCHSDSFPPKSKFPRPSQGPTFKEESRQAHCVKSILHQALWAADRRRLVMPLNLCHAQSSPSSQRTVGSKGQQGCGWRKPGGDRVSSLKMAQTKLSIIYTPECNLGL